VTHILSFVNPAVNFGANLRQLVPTASALLQ
jgi:hypothetical protein